MIPATTWQHDVLIAASGTVTETTLYISLNLDFPMYPTCFLALIQCVDPDRDSVFCASPQFDRRQQEATDTTHVQLVVSSWNDFSKASLFFIESKILDYITYNRILLYVWTNPMAFRI